MVISAELTTDYNVLIKVRDTGIGIHRTDHKTIFKTFEKLPSKQMNATGIGLGLPLAKRMVEMHRSELKLKSELDLGSTFSFDLRVSLDQTRAIKSPNVHKQMIRRADYLEQANKVDDIPKLRSEQETTILIVDDDEINLVVMGEQLAEYNVVKCSNGLDALTVVEEHKPDLILLNLMMPGLNGYEVCQKLRQKYSQIELPIILVTAKTISKILPRDSRLAPMITLPSHFTMKNCARGWKISCALVCCTRLMKTILYFGLKLSLMPKQIPNCVVRVFACNRYWSPSKLVSLRLHFPALFLV